MDPPPPPPPTEMQASPHGSHPLHPHQCDNGKRLDAITCLHRELVTFHVRAQLAHPTTVFFSPLPVPLPLLPSPSSFCHCPRSCPLLSPVTVMMPSEKKLRAVTFCLSGLYIITSYYVKGMVKSMALFSKNSTMLLPCFLKFD